MRIKLIKYRAKWITGYKRITWVVVCLTLIILLNSCQKKNEKGILESNLSSLIKEQTGIAVSENEKEVQKEAQDIEEIKKYYGTYKISEFWPDVKPWIGSSYDLLPWEEIELFLQQQIVISEDVFITYDNNRYHGGGLRNMNFYIEQYQIENPTYSISENLDELQIFLPKTQDETLKPEKVLTVEDGYLINGNELVKPEFIITKGEKLIMILEKACQYFILDKISDEYTEDLAVKTCVSNKNESEAVLERIRGEYKIKEFLPSSYWPDRMVPDEARIISKQEAEDLLGRTIVLQKDIFHGYYYYYEFPLYEESFMERREEELNAPRYIVKKINQNEIYQLWDENWLSQNGIPVFEEYTEISLDISFDGIKVTDQPYVPKFYILSDDVLLMMLVNEFFLLERC